MPFARLTYLYLLAISLVLIPLSQQAVAQTAAPADAVEKRSFEYKLTVDGAPNDDIKDLMEQTSRLEQLKNTPVVSVAALKRRANEDIEGFKRVLRSEGYYSNEVDYKIDEDQTPINVVYTIKSGPQFRLTRFDIQFTAKNHIPEAPSLADLDIELGEAARADKILSAQRKVVTDLANRGYPEAQIADQNAVVDFATDAMEVTLTVDSGPLLHMGNLAFEGLEKVEPQYLEDLAEWTPGGLYDTRTVDELRRKYLRTGLFGTVRLKSREAVTGSGTVPITFIFVERDRRSIGVGASYSTSEGVGTQFYWENRNLFGSGEKLRADLTLAQIRQELKLTFTRPNYLTPGQNFNANFDVKHENTDAYTEDSISTYAGFDQKWQENWVLSAGTSLEFSRIDDNGVTNNYALAGLPLTARYDSTDDLLDPTTGFRLGTTAVPYLGLNQVSPNFLRFEADGSTYYPVVESNRLVLAARGKIGMMAGEDADEIPATKRFYSGGGGSVRGYKYQSVGPLDANNDPIGGRSLLEVGFEARVRVTDTIGIVPFVEGGNVYEAMVPDFSGEFLWGAGLGFRYYTAIGPIRFDVAVPLNRRDGIDDAYQFYISIGQAF